MGGTAVFVDEAHFIKPLVIKNGPVAMLGMDANIMMASTPATGPSGISGILNARLDGKAVCKKIDFEFTCPACKRRQISDPTVVCYERLYLRPHIQNLNAIRIAQAVSQDDPESFAREHMGVSVFENYSFIAPEHIENLRSADFHTPQFAPKEIFVSVDPNRGSKHFVGNHNSDYAIVTAYYDEGKLVVKKLVFFIFFSFTTRHRQNVHCCRSSPPAPPAPKSSPMHDFAPPRSSRPV